MSLDHEKIKANATVVEKGARILMQGCQNKAIMIGDTQASDMNAAMLGILVEIQQEAGTVAKYYPVLVNTPTDLDDLEGIEKLAKDAAACFEYLNSLLVKSIVPFAEEYNKETPQDPKEKLLEEMLDRVGQVRCELAKLQQYYKWLRREPIDPTKPPWSTTSVTAGEKKIMERLDSIETLLNTIATELAAIDDKVGNLIVG